MNSLVLEVVLCNTVDMNCVFTARYVNRRSHQIWLNRLDDIYTPELRHHDIDYMMSWIIPIESFLYNWNYRYFQDKLPICISERLIDGQSNLFIGHVNVRLLLSKEYKYVSCKYIIYAYVNDCITYDQCMQLLYDY